jgi:hypothetical protein
MKSRKVHSERPLGDIDLEEAIKVETSTEQEPRREWKTNIFYDVPARHKI